MNLQITQALLDKVNFFLRAFPAKEWSGPAWYLTLESDDADFPIDFQLIDFHPLDLGDTASTEWDSDDFAKIIKSKYKENAKLKKCYIGLLHSHHSMGAFFSSTDTETLNEMAPEKGFYPSLVVSSKPDKEFAFAFSYLDQYHREQVIEGDIEITGSIKAPKEWKAIAEEIKEKAKTTTYVPARTGYGYSYGRQESLGWEDNLVLDEKILRKGKDLWSKYKNPQHDMDHKEMSDKMDKLGIKNPYSVFGSTTGYYY